MNELETLHRRAMSLAEEAGVEAAAGHAERARELYAAAFDHERRAAAMLIPSVEIEPTRSVLLRSAASLALDCGEHRNAEQLIAHGLAGNPPVDIANDLRDLLEQVHFQRHLDLHGIVLEPTGFQMSLAGQAVGFGVVSGDSFLPRAQDLDRLIVRTAQRRAKKVFRERLNRATQAVRQAQLYFSVPREASFAVTVHVGFSEQMELPELGVGASAAVIEDALDCLEAVQAGNVEEIRRRIPDPAYRRNFLALAKRLAPDGRAISAVGFTALKPGGGERRILLTRTQASMPAPVESVPEEQKNGELVEILGVLRYADSKFASKADIVGLVDDDGLTHKVRVPEGMMDDIVRPLWDYRVAVTGFKRKGRPVFLSNIAKLEDEGEEAPPSEG